MDDKQTDAQAGQLLPIRKVAELSGIRASTIYRWHVRGLIAFHDVDGKSCLVWEEFLQWLDSWLKRPRRTGRIMEKEWLEKRQALLGLSNPQ